MGGTDRVEQGPSGQEEQEGSEDRHERIGQQDRSARTRVMRTGCHGHNIASGRRARMIDPRNDLSRTLTACACQIALAA